MSVNEKRCCSAPLRLRCKSFLCCPWSWKTIFTECGHRFNSNREQIQKLNSSMWIMCRSKSLNWLFNLLFLSIAFLFCACQNSIESTPVAVRSLYIAHPQEVLSLDPQSENDS